ncbi:AAA family ATPase [Xanthomonas sp. 3793]|uniref:AAA family ATPase n=1 Tax=Xanthomonas sp. 3793 TaxID=3035312 RepID=UPI002DD65A3C|nr:AAA family ATPase [Xanthomonas sp. 3793]
MRINRIEITRLYGTYTKNVDFNSDLNLLVGINGSGKTSILNCIDWLTRPNLARLACTQFQSMKLFIEIGIKQYIIYAHKNISELTISIEGLGGDPIKVKITRPLATIKNEEDMLEALEEYRGLTPESHERQVWDFLKSLSKPLTVTLDRTISAESEHETFYEPGRGRVRGAKSPLAKVASVTRHKYAIYTNRVRSHTESLKSRIILSAFRSPFIRMRDPRLSVVTLDELEMLKSKVTSLLYASVEIDEKGSDSINAYFDEARDMVRYGMTDENARKLFSAQYQQIFELAEAFRLYEEASVTDYEQIGSYLNSLNNFFRESGKSIGFNEGDGTLGFQFIGMNGEPSGAYLALDRMSSGERQLLILVTFLAFISRRNRVFIVDEPELSLHPRWQRSFVEVVLKQSPKGTQVIMATHSPEIVSKYRASCVILDKAHGHG